MSSIAILLLALVGFFVLVLFMVVLGVVAWGAYRLFKPKATAVVDELQSIDLTDGIDEREAEIIARYGAAVQDLLTKQLLASKESKAKEALTKVFAK